MKKMTEYQKVLEKFRTHYRNEYGINLDDEVLYFFVRINEMHAGLKSDIRNIPKLTFKTGSDYFLYGLGKWLIPSLILTLILAATFAICAWQQSQQLQGQIVIKNSIPYLEIKSDTSNYYLPIQKK